MQQQFQNENVSQQEYWKQQCDCLRQEIQMHKEFLNTQVSIYDNQGSYSLGELIGIAETPEDFQGDFVQDNFNDGGKSKKHKNTKRGGGIFDSITEFRKLYIQHASEQNVLAYRLDEIVDKVSKDSTLTAYLNEADETKKKQMLADNEAEIVNQQIERQGQRVQTAVKQLVNPFIKLTQNQVSNASSEFNVQSNQSFVKDLLTAYEQLTIQEKLHGIQKIFYEVLKLLWKRLMDRLNFPRLPFDGIKDFGGFVNKVTDYIQVRILDNLTADADLETLKEIVTSSIQVIHMVKLMIKTISNQDQEEKYTLDVIYDLLQQLIFELSTVKTYITKKEEKNNNFNIISYTNSIKAFMTERKKMWLARLDLLQNRLKDGYHRQQSINQLNSEIDKINNALSDSLNNLTIVSDEQKLSDIIKHYITHFLNLIKIMPRYVGLDISLSDMIKNSKSLQEVLGKTKGFVKNAQQHLDFNINTNLTTKLIGWTRNTWNSVSNLLKQVLPNIPQFVHIPSLEDVFSIFSICFSFSTDFAGFGLVTIINMGIMILYYINALNAKPLYCGGRKNPTMCDLKAYQAALNKQFNSLRGGGSLDSMPMLVQGTNLSPSRDVSQCTQNLLLRYELLRYKTMYNIDVQPTLDSKLVKKMEARNTIVDNICKDNDNPDFNVLVEQYLNNSMASKEMETFINNNQAMNELDTKINNNMGDNDEFGDVLASFFIQQYDNERHQTPMQPTQQQFRSRNNQPLRPTIQNPRSAPTLPPLSDVRVKNPMAIGVSQNLPPIRRGGASALTTKNIKEISNFLNQKTKDELYAYAKSKKYNVSREMQKQELVECIIDNHKRMKTQLKP